MTPAMRRANTLLAAVKRRRCVCECGVVMVEGAGPEVVGTCAICMERDRRKERGRRRVMELKAEKRGASKRQLTREEEDQLFEKLARGE